MQIRKHCGISLKIFDARCNWRKLNEGRETAASACSHDSHQGALVKLIHLCLLTILVCASSVCSAQPQFSVGVNSDHDRLANANPRWFRPVADADVLFRGQSDGVPLPPGASFSGGGVPAGIPSNGPVSIPAGPNGAYHGSGIGGPILNGPINSGPVINAGGTFSQSFGGIQPTAGFVPQQTVQSAPPGSFQAPVAPNASTWNAFAPPLGADPFIAGPQFQQPFGGGFPGAAGNQAFSTFGAQGPSPFRTGVHQSLDVEWIPETSVSGNANGNFEQFGIDYTLGYTGSFIPGWVYSWENEFRYRGWDGPQGVPGLPGSAYRFGFNFEVESAQAGPISVKLGVRPSLNSDLGGSIASDAFQLDGRALVLFQLSPSWTAILGAGYWDRVNDRVIPYVGVVYQNDLWQVKLMFPESEISLFVGNEALGSKWIYARAEYHVEAYNVNTGNGRDGVEFEDTRVLLGFRMDGGTYQWYTEGGWIFDRTVDFGNNANGAFDPSTGFVLRMGWKY